MYLTEEVSPEVYFRLADGRVLKSVPELLEALKNMEEWVYNHHVNAEKNDFANWIADVYGDEELALGLKNSKKQRGVVKAIKSALKKSSKEEKKNSKKKELQQREEQKREQQKENSKKIEPPKKKSDILNLLRIFR
jgi:23S rRNA G2069 N7-methylase RlmK/C1962 C5-methylase RlmI